MECLAFCVEQQGAGLTSAMMRYDVLCRAAKSMKKCALSLLAFGINDHQIRFLVEGDMSKIINVIRGVKVGTTRYAKMRGIQLKWGQVSRIPTHEADLLESVEWAHRGAIVPDGTGPLTSGWSSHRDLLGYREAPFYDPSLLAGRISVDDLHIKMGGRPCMDRFLPVTRFHRESLSLLLRVSGSVMGVLPADKKCFRLFAQLAKMRGWRSVDIAHALSLTARRVRQLLSQPDPRLGLAYLTLGDPRLCHVP
jgi:hypothetical protein